MRAQAAVGFLLLGGALGISSCANTAPPKQFRTFLVPPVSGRSGPQTPLVAIEPPTLSAAWYASEVPNPSSPLPSVARPSDTDFLIKKADDRFAAGKRAFQEGRVEDA